jgi:hypothetical protein
MTKSDTTRSQQQQHPTRDRSVLFLVGAAAAHAFAFIGCPSIVVPPRISEQVNTVALAVAICILPPGSSIYLLFRSRTLAERVIAWVSFIVSLFWLLLAYSFVQQLLKGP